MDQDIEAVRPIESPLDVLAQVIISMTGFESWDIDELFNFIRTSTPYHPLKRRQFDLVLEMLAGRYADTRLRELKPRVSMDKIDNTVQGKEGVLRLIYLSGGTIPDRGYYDLRIADSKAKIGELDEEFVWERSIGDTFTLGAQVWRIQKVTHNDVEVCRPRSNRGFSLSGRPRIKIGISTSRKRSCCSWKRFKEAGGPFSEGGTGGEIFLG